jgi:hypothetical protein
VDASRQLLVLSQLDRELESVTRRLNRMAIDDIKAAFNWGARKANAQLGSARLRYDGAGRQVLELAGTRADGSAFSVVSPPFAGDPNAQAQAIGEELAAQPAQPHAQTTDPGVPMSITGSSYLASTARERIAKAKAKIAASQTKLGGALDQLDQSAAGMDQIATTIEKEAAELTAAAAQFTNQPPAEEKS